MTPGRPVQLLCDMRAGDVGSRTRIRVEMKGHQDLHHRPPVERGAGLGWVRWGSLNWAEAVQAGDG